MVDKPRYAPRENFAGRGGSEGGGAPDFAATTLEPPRVDVPPTAPQHGVAAAESRPAIPVTRHGTQPWPPPEAPSPPAPTTGRSPLFYAAVFLALLVLVTTLGAGLGAFLALL